MADLKATTDTLRQLFGSTKALSADLEEATDHFFDDLEGPAAPAPPVATPAGLPAARPNPDGDGDGWVAGQSGAECESQKPTVGGGWVGQSTWWMGGWRGTANVVRGQWGRRRSCGTWRSSSTSPPR